MKHPHKRRWYGFTQIENALQIRHVSRVVVCASVYVVVSTVIFALFYVSEIAPSSTEARRLTLGWVLSMSGMSVLFAVLVGLYVTRRIAGPLHRIKSDLSRFLEGDDGVRIRLRGRDEMSDLADLINRLLEEKTRTGAAAASTSASALRTELQKILDDIRAPGMAPSEAIETLAERLEALTSPAVSGSA